jgi:hypothetical protein
MAGTGEDVWNCALLGGRRTAQHKMDLDGGGGGGECLIDGVARWLREEEEEAPFASELALPSAGKKKKKNSEMEDGMGRRNVFTGYVYEMCGPEKRELFVGIL